ncbi:MAG: energy transducer TonB [Parvularculaceae bacterium]
MRRIFWMAAILVAGTTAAIGAETPATSANRRPPDFPSSCLPQAGATPAPQRVTVAYDVSRKGLPENVRVTRSTDACFNETAIAAVRSWTFEPRRIDGAAAEQTDMETTFTFVMQQQAALQDFDARPLVRVPPRYPEKCMSRADDREFVLVEFDVSAEGATENIRTVKSTNGCLNGEAEKSVAKWRYQPATSNGQPTRRKGVQTTISFELTSSYKIPPDMRIRGSLMSALMSAQRKSRQDGGGPEALARLAEIEEEYGWNFTKAELSAFHQVRAGARLEAGDYRGALDDLRVVRRAGVLNADQIGDIEKVIAQLEAALEADAKQAPPQEQQPQAEPKSE